jgi:hypothetical protein
MNSYEMTKIPPKTSCLAGFEGENEKNIVDCP